MHFTDYQYITECRQPHFLYTRCLHLSALIYTCLHAVCTCLHPLHYKPLHLAARRLYHLHNWYRGNGFLIRATEKSASRYCSNRPTQALRHAAVAEENRGRISMQTSADKCRRVQATVQIKTKLSTLRNRLIINAVQTNSVE